MLDGIDGGAGGGNPVNEGCRYTDSSNPQNTISVIPHGREDVGDGGFASLDQHRAGIAAVPKAYSAPVDEPLFGTGAFRWDNAPQVAAYPAQAVPSCALDVPSAGQVNGVGQPFTLYEITANSTTQDIPTLCAAVRQLTALLY